MLLGRYQGLHQSTAGLYIEIHSLRHLQVWDYLVRMVGDLMKVTRHPHQEGGHILQHDYSVHYNDEY